MEFELENGDYEVAVSAPEKDLYQPSDNRLVTIDGEDVMFPVQLQSAGGDGPETHTLTVTIIDQTNAGPMQGTATVNGETKDVPGDQGAQFEVENGTYTVTGEASEDGWHVRSEEATIDGDDAKVALPANPIQTVTVETGEPGVDVTLTGPAADEAETKTTGDDGRVEFEALPGNYSITADGYESAEVTVPGAHDPEPVELTPKTTSTPTHTLTITNAGTAPVEIMKDAPPDEDHKTTTHEPVDGVVETEVAEGSYYISTDDRVDTLVSVHVDSNTEIELQDPDPEPLTIEVVDAATGEGIAGAEISGLCHLWYSGGDEYITGMTGSDGVADAQPGVSPTICETTIRADGYKDEHVRISVPEDDGLVVELQPVDEASDDAATNSTNTSNATAATG